MNIVILRVTSFFLYSYFTGLMNIVILRCVTSFFLYSYFAGLLKIRILLVTFVHNM